MVVEDIEINKLIPAEYNPRALSEKEKRDLLASLQGFGMVEPIVVNKAKGRENIIIGGHQRYYVLKERGDKTIPVVYVEISDLKREQELNLRLNKNSGHWEWDLLANFDEEFLKAVGFEYKELDKIFKGVDEDDPIEVYEGEPDSKLGEVYQLGRHSLMCGDATKIEDVEKLMNGQKADCIYTDPPYGMNLETNYDDMFSGDASHKDKGDRFKKVIADQEYFDPSFLFTLFPDTKEVYLWGADYFYDSLPRGGSWSAWDKRTESLDAVIGNTTEFLWSKTPHRRMTARVLWSGHHGMGKDDDKLRIHPTQKPIGLHAWFFDNYAKNFMVILDLFGGSGSTLIACEQTNRTCYMMELDPKYCDVIRRRYAKFIGKEHEWQKITPEL